MQFILFESSAAHVLKVPPERLNELAGRLEVFPLFDLLQFFASAGKPGLLRVTDAEAVEGECFFSTGRIAHANYLHYRGEEAVLAMLCWQPTHFTFHVGVELTGPPDRIDLAPLLMDAARLIESIRRPCTRVVFPARPPAFWRPTRRQGP